MFAIYCLDLVLRCAPLCWVLFALIVSLRLWFNSVVIVILCCVMISLFCCGVFWVLLVACWFGFCVVF